MNRFLLTDNKPEVHVELSTDKQDSLLTQSWGVNFSDCACSPSPNNNAGNNEMNDLQFENRKDELTAIKMRTKTRKIIDAPAGYGKSQLLRKLREDYTKEGKQCACVDFEDTTEATRIRKQIAAQLNISYGGKNLSTTQLLKDINKLGGDVVLFFDSVEKASESDLEWLLENFVPKCENRLPNINFLVIFAGRNMDSGDYNRRKRWKTEKFETIKLSEFSLSVIERVIRNKLKAIDTGFSYEMYKDWAERILKLSGGHPRSIRNLILEELLPTKGFLPTSREGEIELFTKHVEPQIKEVIDKETLSEDLYQALDSIFVFRSFYTEHFSFLQEKMKISQSLDPLGTLQKLANRGLIILNDDDEHYSDAIVRNLILTRWQLLQPEEYIEFNDLAYQFYSRDLNELQPGGALYSYSRRPSTFKSMLRRTIREGFYHLCQVHFANSNANSTFDKTPAIHELKRYITFLENVPVDLGSDPDEYLRYILENDQDNLAVLESKGINIDQLFEKNSAPNTPSPHGLDISVDNHRVSVNRTEVHQKLVEHFNLEEFKNICFNLDVKYDILGGEGLAAKARELITYLENRKQLVKLIVLMKAERPNILWADASSSNSDKTFDSGTNNYQPEAGTDDFESHGAVSIGIVIALKEEFEEIFPQIVSQPIFNHQISQWYYRFTQGKYHCVVTFMNDVGSNKAALVGDRMIEEFKPTTIVNIGIAGSLDKDALVGDVVVATQTDNYLHDSKAVIGGSDLEYVFQLSGDPYKTSPQYVSHAANIDFAFQNEAKNWNNLCQHKLEALVEHSIQQELLQKKLIRPRAKIHTGNIASGQTVGGTKHFTKWLKNHDRKYLALEMESVGVMLAAHTRAVDTLIIRGISDYSNERKPELEKIRNGALRRYAMHNAIALLWAYMNAALI